MLDSPHTHHRSYNSVEAFQSLRVDVEAIRQNIMDLKVRYREIGRTKVDQKTAHERVRLWAEGIGSEIGVPSPISFTGGRDDWKPPATDVSNLVADLLRELLFSEMQKRVSALYTGKQDKGLEAFERSEVLARIDREILDCELAEESIIRGAEAAGITIDRRSEADPRAVLADSSVLP